MTDTLRKPPAWRLIAAALRRLFKPERPNAPPPPAPPLRKLTPAQEDLYVAEFGERVQRAVAVYLSKMAEGDEAPRFDLFVADMAKMIDGFVRKRAAADATDLRPLVERLRRELPGLVAAAWRTKPTPAPAAPAPPPAIDMPYRVESFDNHELPGEGRPLKQGEFRTAAEAEAFAQKLIDDELLRAIGNGYSAANAVMVWRCYGEAPVVVGPRGISCFDPFDYAERRAAELAAAQVDPDGERFRRFMKQATKPIADEDGQLLMPF